MIREDHPLASLHHVKHFFIEEVMVEVGRLVGSTIHGLVFCFKGPMRRGHLGRSSKTAEVFQMGSSGMGKSLDIRSKVCGCSKTAYRGEKTVLLDSATRQINVLTKGIGWVVRLVKRVPRRLRGVY